MMKPRDRWIAFLIAAVGICVCLVGVSGFVGKIRDNDLAWNYGHQSAQDHYLAVGQSYGEGFVTGFFLCFSLVLIAVVVGLWAEQRKRTAAEARATPPLEAVSVDTPPS